MILVRQVFQAQFGKGGELAAYFKESVAQMRRQFPERPAPRVLTDLSGNFDTVVMEIEVESLDAFFKAMQEMFADPEWQQEAARGGALMASGYREFYTIEA